MLLGSTDPKTDVGPVRVDRSAQFLCATRGSCVRRRSRRNQISRHKSSTPVYRCRQSKWEPCKRSQCRCIRYCHSQILILDLSRFCCNSANGLVMVWQMFLVCKLLQYYKLKSGYHQSYRITF